MSSNTTYLQPTFDRAVSFYKKAKVIQNDKELILTSYNTEVAKIKNKEFVIKDYYSMTTARHINEFLRQNGFDQLSKSEMIKESKKTAYSSF
jgi:hypothetical protein